MNKAFQNDNLAMSSTFVSSRTEFTIYERELLASESDIPNPGRKSL